VKRLNETLQRRGVAGIVSGECSVFHIMLGDGMAEAVQNRDVTKLMGARSAAVPLRKAMLLEGVDLMRTGGFTSVAHGDEEIAFSIGAFDRALERLQAEGIV
jgi:glutamate-1-semialdehyde aminotransferase